MALKAKGEIRSQFHHLIDVAPTILEAAGLPEPVSVNGVQQRPIEGVSMLYSFNDPKAAMSDANEKLTPADPKDLAQAIAFALRYSGRKRAHDADEYMAQVAAERIVEHLMQSRFVVMKRPPIGGGATLGCGEDSRPQKYTPRTSPLIGSRREAAIVRSAVATGGDSCGLKNSLSGDNLSLTEASIWRISGKSVNLT
jgi:hypothetical protein